MPCSTFDKFPNDLLNNKTFTDRTLNSLHKQKALNTIQISNTVFNFFFRKKISKNFKTSKLNLFLINIALLFTWF